MSAMTFITKKHLPRRTFLRGLGATIALPLLDSMVPALTALSQTAAQPVRRLGVVYVPNGQNIWQWTPPGTGTALELTTPILQPLAPFRDQVLLVSNLCNSQALVQLGDGTGEHPRSQAAFLTGVYAKKTEGADIRNGISMDQIVAKEFSRETQLSSLELSLETAELSGGCDQGYSCAYVATIAWRSETLPLPMEFNPRAVFERMFGASDSTDASARLQRLKVESSMLDTVSEELAQLQRELGTSDRVKVKEYLDSVRDIERRIQRAEEQSDRELPEIDRPAGVPDLFADYAKLQFDLMALAYQTDMTRVATYLVGREKSSRSYPEIGVPESYHPISHHQNRPELLEKYTKINRHHMEMFAHFLERLRSTPDGDGSLLDHSLILYGAGMSNGDAHVNQNLPLLLAGGAGGRIQGGRHLRFADDTPLSNLHLTLLDKMGIPVERFGDSTGQLNLLAGV